MRILTSSKHVNRAPTVISTFRGRLRRFPRIAFFSKQDFFSYVFFSCSFSQSFNIRSRNLLRPRVYVASWRARVRRYYYYYYYCYYYCGEWPAHAKVRPRTTHYTRARRQRPNGVTGRIKISRRCCCRPPATIRAIYSRARFTTQTPCIMYTHIYIYI